MLLNVAMLVRLYTSQLPEVRAALQRLHAEQSCGEEDKPRHMPGCTGTSPKQTSMQVLPEPLTERAPPAGSRRCRAR